MTDRLDPERVIELAAELQARPVAHVVLTAHQLLTLVGLVQLALRHPGVSGISRGQGEELVATAREYFAGCPTALGVIDEASR